MRNNTNQPTNLDNFSQTRSGDSELFQAQTFDDCLLRQTTPDLNSFSQTRTGEEKLLENDNNCNHQPSHQQTIPPLEDSSYNRDEALEEQTFEYLRPTYRESKMPSEPKHPIIVEGYRHRNQDGRRVAEFFATKVILVDASTQLLSFARSLIHDTFRNEIAQLATGPYHVSGIGMLSVCLPNNREFINISAENAEAILTMMGRSNGGMRLHVVFV